jgi:hypothetical protein
MLPSSLTASDIPRLVDMGRRFFAATGHPAEYDPEAVAAMLGRMLDDDNAAVFVTPGGMIGGVLMPLYCSPGWIVAAELFWWAEDRSGLKLLRRFEQWGAERGAREIRMTTLQGLPAAETILARRGYVPAEASHSRMI